MGPQWQHLMSLVINMSTIVSISLSMYQKLDNTLNFINWLFSGVLALMLSAYRSKVGDNAAKLDFNTAVSNIESSASTANLTVAFPNYRCDGYFGSASKYPNNQFGYEIKTTNLCIVTSYIWRHYRFKITCSKTSFLIEFQIRKDKCIQRSQCYN